MKICTRCKRETDHTIKCISGYTDAIEYLCGECLEKSIGGYK